MSAMFSSTSPSAVASCCNCGTHDFRLNNPFRATDDGAVRQADIKRFKGVAEGVLASQQILVFTGVAGGDHRPETGRWHIAFKVAIVNQIVRRQFPQVGVDILGSLLSPNAETVADMIGGEPSFP